MFADNVKALRKELGLTQERFGERLGASRSMVKNWEYGAVEPNHMIIKHIHNTFNVREEWLWTGEGPMYEETPKEYVESLIEKHNLGPGGQMLMRSLLRFYEELGEEATLKVIAEILPDAQQVVGEAEVEQFNQYLARNEGSEGSSQESAGSA